MRITMKLTLIFFIFALTLLGCAENALVDKCHDKVHVRAKNSAKIISTTTKSSKSGGLIRIEGRAQLQNGFGALVNYNYFCGVSGRVIISFDMSKGW